MPDQTITATALAALALLGGAITAPLRAEHDHQVLDTEQVKVRVETIASGLEHPWGLALLPDGSYLVTERNPGQLRMGSREGDLSEPVEGVPDVFRYLGPNETSQGGLFHVAAHPRFEDNRLVYLSFAQPSPEGAGTAIARGRLDVGRNGPRLEDIEIIFSMSRHDSGGLNFGGRFAFEPGTSNILLSIGDRGSMSRAQDRLDHAGSIVRVTDTGVTPDDNPFKGDPASDEKIYAKGLRNVQGLATDRRTGELWAVDHGPLGGDEINLVRAGGNYGWPIQTGGRDQSGAPIGLGTRVNGRGLEAPVLIWETAIAPSGLAIYEGALFPQWRGDLLIGGLAARGLVRIRIRDGEVVQQEIMLTELDRRIRDVEVDREGAVWLVTDHEDGEVLRLLPSDPVTTGTIPRKDDRRQR